MSIWNHKNLKDGLSEDIDLLTLDEGFTPEIELKDMKTKLILKREDFNPTGSWKDRGSAYILTKLISRGVKEAVIASSGNAAISLMSYANLTNYFKLHVVISDTTTPDKSNLIKSLENNRHQIYITKEMRFKAVELSSSLGIPNLKVSVDDEILPAYSTLGIELVKYFAKEDNTNNAIFVQVSSGTTLVGLAQGLQSLIQNEFNLPKIFVVQTQRISPIVNLLHKTNENTTSSISDAIIDNKALRSPQILKIINQTKGDALSILNEEIVEAKRFLSDYNLADISNNSLLSVAGYNRLKDIYQFNKVICILSGR